MLSELHDQLRAGDVWVRGSRRYRNFEDCLLPRPTFEALRAEGPLPVGVEEDVERHLATRRDALAAAMADVAVLDKAGRLPDAVLNETCLRITPLKAETPPEALRAAQDAYGMLPRPRITDLLLEVDSWTGISDCFTHQRSGLPVEERAALLTTVLADGINLGLSRMAESCQGHSLRQLAWMHNRHVREAFGRFSPMISSGRCSAPTTSTYRSCRTSRASFSMTCPRVRGAVSPLLMPGSNRAGCAEKPFARLRFKGVTHEQVRPRHHRRQQRDAGPPAALLLSLLTRRQT